MNGEQEKNSGALAKALEWLKTQLVDEQMALPPRVELDDAALEAKPVNRACTYRAGVTCHAQACRLSCVVWDKDQANG